MLYRVRKRFAVEKPKWLVVTDRRIILFDEKLLGRYELKAVPYERLKRVKFHGGVMASSFEIELEDNEGVITVNWLDKEEAKKAIKAVYEALKAVAVEPPSLEKRKGLLGEDWVLTKPKEFLTRGARPAAQAATTGPGGGEGSRDPLEMLRKLRELYEAGVLTKEEYEEKKKRIMEML